MTSLIIASQSHLSRYRCGLWTRPQAAWEINRARSRERPDGRVQYILAAKSRRWTFQASTRPPFQLVPSKL
ncbi:MAG TPA: hypothetical protein VGN34_30945, partial [Ktedonobacteraceae bacterium]